MCYRKKICAVVTAAVIALIGSVTYSNSALAQRTTSWRCWHNGEAKGTVNIWWGHTAGDAAWACNNWISVCGNASGGCSATEL
jgi:hypothetical protein